MTPEETESCPTGWQWVRTGSDRVELGRSGGPTLLAEHLETNRWRVVYRVGREDSTVVDALGTVEVEGPPRDLLEHAAQCVERLDAPDANLGELLTIEGGEIDCREWRIE